MPLLEIENLTMVFGGLTALERVSFAVEPGAIHALIGPNGAGKSTAMNCISRFYTPSSGSVRMAGREVLKLAPHQLIDAGIARTFQNLELCQRLTALDNVLLGQHRRIRTHLFATALGLPGARRSEAQAVSEALAALERLGVGQAAHSVTAGLPFGVLKRIELARAIVSRPRLLLLDEPAAGLNAGERDALIAVIQSLRAEGVTVLMVEHDMGMVMRICDRITVLDFGRVVADGTPEAIRNDPAVIEAYLGESTDAAGA